ncbi:MAG: 50S ribosomal protein L3 N(5)-glutamine methyltransferase [Pseudomonadota bacterium]
MTLPDEIRTVGDAVRYMTSRFYGAGLWFGHGTDNAGDEANALVMQSLGLPFDSAPYVYAAALTEPERSLLAERMSRRIDQREPLAYITGRAWFCGLEFEVDPRVLIPRSPIGELIASRFDAYAALPDGARVLDMCTGGGCLAIACAVWHPDLEVDAVDVSSDALAVARANVARHTVEDRVRLIESDGYNALDDQRRYDLIIANPPYVPAKSIALLPAEYRHEPALALAAGADGLDLVRHLVRDAPRFLTENGVLLLEVGEAAAALEAWLAPFEPLWCDFERGGDGVLALDTAALNTLNIV